MSYLGVEGKRVLVTGSTRGIGRTILDDFLEAGAIVHGTGTNPDVIKKFNEDSSLKNATFHCVDFLNEESFQSFLQVLEGLEIDILVNSAGINKINLTVETQESDWNNIMQMNVTRPLQLIKKVIPHMQKEKWGRIVGITSIFGNVTKAKRVAYTTSKFALKGMAKTLAVDYAEYNILSNTVAPGFIDTELTRTILTENEINDLIAQVPMKRLGTTQEVSQLVLFLASAKNTFITGQDILIDGGFTSV